MNVLMQNISFKTDDKKLEEMFGEKAEKIAKKVNDGSKSPDTSTTQFRKFYDKVLELNEKSQNLSQDEFEIKVLPFLKMLNSKVAYAKTRDVCGDNFAILMNKSIKKVNSVEELQNFKYFLESIIGFMPKK
jgi:CRISPR-associated protein Csm2